MRTLITGATGRIGSRLVPRLLRTGPVRVVVRDVERAGRYWDMGCDVGCVWQPERSSGSSTPTTRRLSTRLPKCCHGSMTVSISSSGPVAWPTPRSKSTSHSTAVYGAGDPLPGGPRVPAVHHADAGQALRLALAADGIDGRVFTVADDAGVVDTRRIRAELGYEPLFPTVCAAQAAGAL